MYLALYVIIGIFILVAIYLIIKNSKVSKEHKIINNDKGKNTQFNPEKVSGLMPNKQKSDVAKDK